MSILSILAKGTNVSPFQHAEKGRKDRADRAGTEVTNEINRQKLAWNAVTHDTRIRGLEADVGLKEHKLDIAEATKEDVIDITHSTARQKKADADFRAKRHEVEIEQIELESDKVRQQSEAMQYEFKRQTKFDEFAAYVAIMDGVSEDDYSRRVDEYRRQVFPGMNDMEWNVYSAQNGIDQIFGVDTVNKIEQKFRQVEQDQKQLQKIAMWERESLAEMQLARIKAKIRAKTGLDLHPYVEALESRSYLLSVGMDPNSPEVRAMDDIIESIHGKEVADTAKLEQAQIGTAVNQHFQLKRKLAVNDEMTIDELSHNVMLRQVEIYREYGMPIDEAVAMTARMFTTAESEDDPNVLMFVPSNIQSQTEADTILNWINMSTAQKEQWLDDNARTKEEVTSRGRVSSNNPSPRRYDSKGSQ